jgi:hypothetical protein
VKAGKKAGLMSAKEKDINKIMNINQSDTEKLSAAQKNEGYSDSLKSAGGSDW